MARNIYEKILEKYSLDELKVPKKAEPSLEVDAPVSAEQSLEKITLSTPVLSPEKALSASVPSQKKDSFIDALKEVKEGLVLWGLVVGVLFGAAYFKKRDSQYEFDGYIGKEKVHFEAVPSKKVKLEMDKFLKWFNDNSPIDPVLKSAIAHFWFIIIHPFDDGNGRIARAISDLMLARADKTTERYYSMSSQILVERKKYYEILQKVQHSTGDITDWLDWFLHCLKNSVLSTQTTLQKILRKTDFWKIHENTPFNERQRLVLNKLFDGFDGKLKSSKWAKIAKCSPDTALRDIKDLIEKGILQQEQQGGRSTNYELANF